MLGAATQTELTVAQGGLLDGSALYRWVVGALREGCSSPTAMLLLLCALHESLLTAQPLLTRGRCF